MTEFYGAPELRKWLEEHGFLPSIDGLRSEHNRCTWYAYRRSKIEARRCECNDDKPGIQLIVKPYLSRLPDGRELRMCEIDLAGEAGGQWYTLKAYSLDIDAVPEKLEQIERALVAAWNALDNGQSTRP